MLAFPLGTVPDPPSVAAPPHPVKALSLTSAAGLSPPFAHGLSREHQCLCPSLGRQKLAAPPIKVLLAPKRKPWGRDTSSLTQPITVAIDERESLLSPTAGAAAPWKVTESALTGKSADPSFWDKKRGCQSKVSTSFSTELESVLLEGAYDEGKVASPPSEPLYVYQDRRHQTLRRLCASLTGEEEGEEKREGSHVVLKPSAGFCLSDIQDQVALENGDSYPDTDSFSDEDYETRETTKPSFDSLPDPALSALSIYDGKGCEVRHLLHATLTNCDDKQDWEYDSVPSSSSLLDPASTESPNFPSNDFVCATLPKYGGKIDLDNGYNSNDDDRKIGEVSSIFDDNNSEGQEWEREQEKNRPQQQGRVGPVFSLSSEEAMPRVGPNIFIMDVGDKTAIEVEVSPPVRKGITNRWAVNIFSGKERVVVTPPQDGVEGIISGLTSQNVTDNEQGQKRAKGGALSKTVRSLGLKRRTAGKKKAEPDGGKFSHTGGNSWQSSKFQFLRKLRK